MGKHTDKLGSFDSFRAPWETEGGSDAEIDKPKLKKWIFNVLSDKAKAQDSRDELDEKLEQAGKDLEAAKAEAADANGEEAQKKIDKLQAKVDKLTEEKEAREAADSLAELRKDVLGDFAEKHPKAAKYVKGETQEELEESLAAVKEDFGISDEPGDGEEEEHEEEKATGRTTPRTRLTNPVDRQSGKPGEGEYDFDKIADEAIRGGGNIFG